MAEQRAGVKRREGVAAVAGAIMALAGTRAEADAPSSAPGGFALQWVRASGAESCPEAPVVEREVARRLGRNPFGAHDRSIEVVVSREGLAWRASIFVRAPDGATVGTRTLTSDESTCEAIASASELAVALAIDPEAAVRAPPPLVDPSSPPPATAVVPAEVSPPTPASPAPAPIASSGSPPPASPRPAPRRDVATASVRAIAQAGLLPAASAGVSVDADVPVAGPLSLSVSAWMFPEMHATMPGVDVAFGVWSVAVGACLAPVRTARVRLEGCANAVAGVVHASVLAGTPVSPANRPWGGASLRAALSVRLVGPLAFQAGLEAVVPIARYRASSGDADATLFEQAPVAAVGGLGLAVAF